MPKTLFPFIIPQKCHRRPIRPTSRNYLGQQVISTRKMHDVYHSITYDYELLSSRQYRIINNHFSSMDGGKTSFYVVDWGNPRPISSISGLRIVLNNVQGFSVNAGDGGNRIIIWQNSGDFGNDCTGSGPTITDTAKAWTVDEWQGYQLLDSVGDEYNASVNSANTLTVVTGTPLPGAYDIHRYVERTVASIDTSLRRLTLSAAPGLSYSVPFEKFALPVYECFYPNDYLSLEPSDDGFNPEPNDNYGPYYEGSIEFIQKGTGT